MALALLLSVFIISTCGLVYELTAGALASYLLGDSITQFSIIIGVYLSAMGIGSYLSRYIVRNVITVFIEVELLIGLVGGSTAAILFTLFEVAALFRPILYFLITLTGILVGLEIPLIMRILKDRLEFKDLVSKIFTFDYTGALFASLLFPLVLVPYLGIIRSSFMFGMINVLVALWTLYLFRDETQRPRGMAATGIVLLFLLTGGFIYSDRIMHFGETLSYQGSIIYSKTSPYQRIVITREGNSIQLHLNGNLQFNSRDEYRYHESLIHPGIQAIKEPADILVLGGGDGMAVREILKYETVRSVTLVDLDREVTELFSNNEMLVGLNNGSLRSPKVKVLNEDAFVWMKGNDRKYDFIVVDFPDPSNYSIGKLYTNSFYRLVYKAVKDTGVVVVQSTSPFVARKSFWCIVKTLESEGFFTTPYHAYLPSFGEWGYVIATKRPFRLPVSFSKDLRFITSDAVNAMMEFPKDMGPMETEVNRLNNQVLVRYFEEDWSHYAH